MELQKMIEERRKTQLKERRTHRSGFNSTGSNHLQATSLKDVTSVTSRTGFLQQQLKMKLTPLRRWCLQLKLLQSKETNDDIESLLAQERAYDVVYREGVRVADVRESLLDEEAPFNVKELLCFSTRSDSFICRISCIKDSKTVKFSCSQFIPNLQPELTRLLDTDQPVSAAISYILKNR